MSGNTVFVLAVLVHSTFALSQVSDVALDVTVRSARWPSVSSPLSCAFDIDCKEGYYCKTVSNELVGLCTRQRWFGQACDTSTAVSSCRPGLFCSTDFGPRGHRCARQVGVGRPCSKDETRQCKHELVCVNNKCRQRLNAGVGDKCGVDFDCNNAVDLYCSENKVCDTRKPTGVGCPNIKGPRFCQGVCQGRRDNFGICIDYGRFGKACAGGCEQRETVSTRTDRIVCASGADSTAPFGKCVRYSTIVKRVGAPCDSRALLCDDRRALTCLWSPRHRRKVCQHVHRGKDPEGRWLFCERGSPLSTCQNDDMECRLERRDVRRTQLTECLRRREFVAPGVRCDDEPIFCTKGSRCMSVRGIRGSVKFCMFERFNAQRCGHKFREQCSQGLTCSDGTCVRTPPGVRDVETHAGSFSNCTALPCPPGLRCTTDDVGRKTCEPPTSDLRTVKGGLLAECDEEVGARLQCRDGLVCRRDDRGAGPLRCRGRVPVGGTCTLYTCAGEAQCRFDSLSSTFKCIPPGNELSFWSRCNPLATIFQPRCRESGGFSPDSLECLPSRDGYRCSVSAGVNEECGDEAGGVVCNSPDLKCTNGVCTPKNG